MSAPPSRERNDPQARITGAIPAPVSRTRINTSGPARSHEISMLEGLSPLHPSFVIANVMLSGISVPKLMLVEKFPWSSNGYP